VILPAHDFHENIDQLMVGMAFPDVHDILDVYAASLGPEHRRYYHNDDAVEYMMQVGGIYVAWSAYYHIVLDRVSDKTGSSGCIVRFLALVKAGVIPTFDQYSPPPLLQETY